ncbi:MAG: hypothetical protein IT161_23725 [Bryobacterales bacterium]|nr:hypothetical protein [Bryobacterales bacterium]
MSAGQETQPDVTRAILGLVFLLALAWAAGHAKVEKLQERLNINPQILAGMVFVLLGLLASLKGVGVLSAPTLSAIAPVLPLGLGWLGFRIGFDFDRELFNNPPAATNVLLAVLIPVLLVVLVCGGLIWFTDQEWSQRQEFWRDLLLVSLTTSMTSAFSISALNRRRPGMLSVPKLAMLAELEQVTALLGLMFIAVIFHPTGDGVGWQLPPLAWLFVTLGAGLAMGALTYGLLSTSKKGPPFIVILLGAIAMAAGMASFLRLSVISVCFVVGLIVSNLPGGWKGQVQMVLQRMGKPVFYILLLFAGALWSPWDWRGWVLLLIAGGARVAGKWLSFRIAGLQGRLDLNRSEQTAAMLAPTGVLAVAVIISAKDLYPDAQVPLMLTSAIGGAALCELMLLSAFRNRKEPQ